MKIYKSEFFNQRRRQQSSVSGSFSSSMSKPSKSDVDDDHKIKFESLSRYVTFVPLILGLSFVYTGWSTIYNSSYTNADESILSNNAALITLGLLTLLFCIFRYRKIHLSQCSVNKIMSACVLGQAVCPIIFALYKISIINNTSLLLGLEILCNLSSSGAIFYWIRRLRGATAIFVTICIFTALLFNEVIIYMYLFLPFVIENIVICILVLMQYLCIKNIQTRDIDFTPHANDYSNFMKSLIANKQFSITTSISIACLAVAAGFLQVLQSSYSYGESYGEILSLAPFARLFKLIIIASLSCAVITLAIHQHKHIINVTIFMLMEALASFSLLCYAIFSASSIFGSGFSATLDTFLAAITCYIAIAFMTYGEHDPYYYASRGWIIWLGGRELARVIFRALTISSLFMCILVGIAVLLSAQAMLILILNINNFKTQNQNTQRPNCNKFDRVANSSSGENQNNVRRASIQRSAQELGRQFLLSEREVEVLALYSLGFTQKRVAEELFISTATVHAHIKRIYAKTDLHSRQDIVDYMQKYTS